MEKKNKNKIDRRLQWVIRILIILIFCLSLGIGANRLMAYQRERREAEELEQRRQELADALNENTGSAAA